MSSAEGQSITVPVWLTPYCEHRASDLHALSLDELTKTTHIGFYGADDWVKVGDAAVTISLTPRADVVKTQVAMLRAAQQKVRADAELAANGMERQIQSLLAIEVTA